MKSKHGTCIEITDKLSSEAATAIAQWIGGYTVIRNQKVFESEALYQDWVERGSPADDRPVSNTRVSTFCQELAFLKGIPSQIRRNAGAKYLESVNAAKAGLRAKPKIKKKHKKRSCYVTNELFDVQPLDVDRCVIQLKQSAKKGIKGRYLLGVVMPFPAQNAAKSLYLSRQGRRFWLSMSFDIELDVANEATIKRRLAAMSDEELEAALTGYDLGVKRQVTGSDGTVYHLPEKAQEAIEKLQKRRARYQRRYARVARTNDKVAGTSKRKRTGGEKKILAKIAKYPRKTANIQCNNSHHRSKEIADSTPLAGVFEGMTISNMVRRPKAKQCPETGRWLRNGAASKRGLNRAIHGANMGQIRDMARYKLKEQGKLQIRVESRYSSQECGACGYTHKDNRKTQAEFVCLACNHTANADDNAAAVIKKRGMALIRSDAFSEEKTVRKTTVRRKKNTAHESASSGCGDNVRLAVTQATVDDALNLETTPV